MIKERSELFFEDTDTIGWDTHSMASRARELDRIFVIIKPNEAKEYGDNIRTHLVGNGYEIVKEKVVHFNEIIYGNLALDVPNEYFDASVKYLATDQIIVMILEKVNGYEDIAEIVGHCDPRTAQQQQPDSIRAIYGKNVVENAIDVSLSKEQYFQNKEIFFDDEVISDSRSYKQLKIKQKQQRQQEERIRNTSPNKKEKCLLVLKPHIHAQHVNEIKKMLIQSDFAIISQRHLNLPYDAFVDAFEKDGDYDANMFDAVCHEFSSGEITIFTLSKLNVYQSIRTLVGPDDPEIARSEAPSSIRARFGQDRIRNCCWYSRNSEEYKAKLEHFEY